MKLVLESCNHVQEMANKHMMMLLDFVVLTPGTLPHKFCRTETYTVFFSRSLDFTKQ